MYLTVDMQALIVTSLCFVHLNDVYVGCLYSAHHTATVSRLRSNCAQGFCLNRLLLNLCVNDDLSVGLWHLSCRKLRYRIDFL